METKRILVTALETRSDKAISALFGKLKTNIDFSFPEKDKICIMTTSALYGEGKSTIAANTAIAMAMSGKKTLLLDADMLSPSVHQFFQYINGGGLFDAITKREDWRRFIIKAVVPNLYIMTAGKKPLNSAKLLGSKKFKSILTDMHIEYDYVVIDTPPVLAVPDAQILSSLADGVLVVVRHGKTTIEALKNTNETIKHANANIIGVVINDKNVKDGSFYGYGYGYGYGKKSHKRNAKQKAANNDGKITSGVMS
jgi:capsular exopolysaccharide synthesis family protein